MVKKNWKYVGITDFSRIMIDTKNRITKIETKKNIYYHEGLYPYHNPDYYKKIKR